ncbi:MULTISPECIES: SymE family type I addiction module toxin [Gilliamella]
MVIASTAGNPTQLTVKGRWLEAFGFTTAQPVIIDAQQGLLIIRVEGLS